MEPEIEVTIDNKENQSTEQETSISEIEEHSDQEIEEYYENENEIEYFEEDHIEDDWEILKELGKGSFGSVCVAKKKNGESIGEKDVKICAIKKIVKEIFKIEEVNILKKLSQDDNYLDYYGLGYDDENYYIYMEYIEGATSIRKKIEDGHKFSDKEIFEIIYKISEAISDLHELWMVIHRDIKSDHILLIYDNENTSELKGIRLIDFGCSKSVVANNTKFNTHVGTHNYTAPEVIMRGGKASRKSDVWSFGCVLLEMLGGNLSTTDEKNIPFIPETIDLRFKHILQQCLVIDPNGRSSFSNIFIQLKQNIKLPLYNQSKAAHNNNNKKFLDLSSYNHSALLTGVIPSSVTNLNLSSYNHSALSPGVLPNGLKELILSSYNHSAISAGVLSNSITELNLSSYNHPLTVGDIPNGVKSLDISSYSHHLSVGVIPHDVKVLNLSSFNHSALITGVIPNSVGYLNLSSYNHSEITAGVIPNSTVYLHLSSYNHSALTVGVIPNSVKEINLSSYNHPIAAGVIPNGVKLLNLSSYNNSALTVGVIPNSVTDLNLSSYNHSEITAGIIPNGVKILNLSSYNYPLTSGVIPNSVQHLNLSSFNHQLFKGLIPEGVRELLFKNFSQSIEFEDIPTSVTSKEVGEDFDLYVDGMNLPEFSITTLKCGFDFSKVSNKRSQILNQKCYPASVVNLSLPKYNSELKQNSISQYITVLELGSNFKHIKTLAFIPPSVFQLKFGDPEFNVDREKYLSNIKPFIKSSVSMLIINGENVSEEFYNITL